MLPNQTIEKLEALGLHAMAAGLSEQLSAPGTYDELPFADRLGLLVDKEADARDSRRLAARLKAAKLRYPAAVEDIDFRAPRGLERSVVLSLAQGAWVREHHNVLVTGPTGCGKSFLACALANAAIRQGHTALYLRAPRLLDDLALGRADGRYARTLAQVARVGVLVLDDFLLAPAPVEACRDLLEVMEVSLGPPLDGRGEPVAGRQVAPLDGRPDARRRGPRPRLPGSPPHRHEGLLDAQTPARASWRGPRAHELSRQDLTCRVAWRIGWATLTTEDDHWHRLPSGLSAFGRNRVRFRPEPVSRITGIRTRPPCRGKRGLRLRGQRSLWRRGGAGPWPPCARTACGPASR